MRRIRLTLEFDGSDFFGWQKQARTGERTVQAVVESALSKLPGDHGSVVAAGRTDAGVHALALTAHVDIESVIPDDRLRQALNAHLPRDVVVLDASTCEPDFEAQYDCRYRRYLYRMRVVRDVPRGVALDRRRVLPLYDRLDLEQMQAACHALVGRHDFASFATQEVRSTVRTVHLCELRVEAGEVRLHIAAQGFLRNMVRTVVGTLLWVGRGKLRADELPEIIAARDRARAGHNVPAYALYFVEAGYTDWNLPSSEATLQGLLVGDLAAGPPSEE